MSIKKISNNKLKRISSQNYVILVGLIVVYVVYRSYFKIDTIGRDSRYFFTVLIIPTVLGIAILGIIKRNFLKNRLKNAKGALQKGFLILLYLIQGFLFSYLSIGQFVNMIWDNLNYKTANLNPTEIIDCQITNFNSGTSKSSPNIYFMFRGHNESLTIDHETYGKYFDSKLTNLNLQVTVRKGIWNHYIIDNWRITNNR
jgi:hypothetical protein